MEGGGGTYKYHVHAKSTLAGIQKTFTTIEEYEGIPEWLVRDLGIEEALQIKIKGTLAHNNQSYLQWFSLSEEGRNKTM